LREPSSKLFLTSPSRHLEVTFPFFSPGRLSPSAGPVLSAGCSTRSKLTILGHASFSSLGKIPPFLMAVFGLSPFVLPLEFSNDEEGPPSDVHSSTPPSVDPLCPIARLHSNSANVGNRSDTFSGTPSLRALRPPPMSVARGHRPLMTFFHPPPQLFSRFFSSSFPLDWRPVGLERKILRTCVCFSVFSRVFFLSSYERTFIRFFTPLVIHETICFAYSSPSCSYLLFAFFDSFSCFPLSNSLHGKGTLWFLPPFFSLSLNAASAHLIPYIRPAFFSRKGGWPTFPTSSETPFFSFQRQHSKPALFFLSP